MTNDQLLFSILITKQLDLSLQKAEKLVITIFYIIYGGGVIAHLSPFLFSIAQSLTEILLYVSNALVFYFLLKSSPSKKLAYWIIIAAVLTFFIEVAGVATGKIFGPYEYGQTLKLKAWGVPFIIGINWVILTLGGFAIIQQMFLKILNTKNSVLNTKDSVLNTKDSVLSTKYSILNTQYSILSTKNSILISLLTASTVATFDWVMEPIAIWLDYWHWFDQPIPFQNYLTWFIISFLASFTLQQLNLQIRSQLLTTYFLIQLIFFALLRIFGG